MVWLKRGVALLALGIAIYLFWPLVGELRAAANLFKSAHWEWLPVVLAVEAISYAFLTWLNALALKPFPGHIGFFHLAALLTSMAFIEVAIPSAGASGVVLRARLLGRRGGYSQAASTFTLGLETVVLAATMTSVALLGLFYLLHHGELTAFQTALLAVIGLTVIALVWGGWRTMNDPENNRRLFRRLAESWNHLAVRLDPQGFGSAEGCGSLRKRLQEMIRPIDPARLEARLAQFQSGLAGLRQVPVWMFFAAGVGRVALDVTTLGVCFLLFGYTISPGALLTGYGLILVASGLAALPGGLGMADLSIPGLFLRLGVPGSVALAAGLTYRLVAFWLLRFIGFLSWQYLEYRR